MADLPPAKILPNAVKTFNKKGFTLIEVVVATLILAVLAAGVAGAFWSAQHFLSRARHRVQAFNFAMEALDRLRSNYNYLDEEMSVGSGYLASGIGCSIAGEMAALAPGFTYDVTEPQVSGYKQVTIKVDWNEPSLKD
ncbi:MAG: prepilin-type N-terminal cleavage/methylation domain-containing protein [Candidatus Omnitrophota bacterium]|nr:prepilin-type N-terminal cleavage/methylation domain-containing protein [Candidatus Omnitrophota bacterium]